MPGEGALHWLLQLRGAGLCPGSPRYVEVQGGAKGEEGAIGASCTGQHAQHQFPPAGAAAESFESPKSKQRTVQPI